MARMKRSGAAAPDVALADALALLDEWEATPEHAHRQSLDRFVEVERYINRVVDSRPRLLDAALIPLA